MKFKEILEKKQTTQIAKDNEGREGKKVLNKAGKEIKNSVYLGNGEYASIKQDYLVAVFFEPNTDRNETVMIPVEFLKKLNKYKLIK
jgi:hypothetical protein